MATPPREIGQVTDQNPIINDPFAEPTRYWHFQPGAPPQIHDGRRVAGYVPPERGRQLQMTSELVVLETVNRIRARVGEWRAAGYPGATPVTRALFTHWFDPERERRPFFAQREAIETIAWLTEAPPDRRVGIVITQHEAYQRWAIKLATGAGKTLVMAMTITWSGLNKLASRQDRRFADAFLVVAPNLTVKGRLTGDDGLVPSHPRSAYDRFELIPGQYAGLVGRLRIQVVNWHQLAPQEDPRRSVLRRGPESDAAFARRVLADLGSKRRIMVINDEAHHAWRPPPDLRVRAREDQEEVREATVWVDGLARIHADREILRCVDFSATPMYPGAVGGDQAWRPFEWVVSDFGLVDAIESGLVKVPRIPTDDDSGRATPKYRNLWEHVKAALPKRGDDPDDAGHPLIAYLSEVDGPLKQLAGAWHLTQETWAAAGRPVPPVLIIVCSETRMAEMLERHIAERGDAGPWLQNRPGEHHTVRIDSRLLGEAEAREEGESAHDAAARLRELVATVGKPGEPGERVRCLISVGMLSEGWDARNVTQILGLRAFQSQLLCEQVVGRGLRRSDHTDLSQPEFVDVYGVPFELLPFARAAGPPVAPPETTTVRSLADRAHLRIEFPRVERIISDVGDEIAIDIASIEPVVVSATNDPTATWVEFEVGTPGQGIGGQTQDRSVAYAGFRMQRMVFRLAADLLSATDKLGKPWLFPQVARIVREVIDRRVIYEPGADPRELGNLRYVVELRNRIIEALRPGERDGLLPILNEYEPIGDTTVNFQTSKLCEPATKSHVSHAVCDSKLEQQMVRALEQHPRVVAHAKNERLFFEIPYRWQGTTGRYRPDFLIRLDDGTTVVIEAKGSKTERDAAKLTAARRWIEAVNGWGRLGEWRFAICFSEAELRAELGRVSDGRGQAALTFEAR